MWKSRKKTCSVVNCKNGNRNLNVWEATVCELHPLQVHKESPCLLPFVMHTFPQSTHKKLNHQRWTPPAATTQRYRHRWHKISWNVELQ